MEHLTPEEFETLVMGFAGNLGESRHRHLATCEACARRLALEARLELDLFAAVPDAAHARERSARRVGVARLLRIALPIAAALAIVVALSRMLAPGPEAPQTTLLMPSPGMAPDTPCLVDPRGLGPGHDVVAPSNMCLDVVAPRNAAPPL